MSLIHRRTTGYSLAIISDIHRPDANFTSRMAPLITVLQAQPNVVALLACGDLDIAQWVEDEESDDFDDWITSLDLDPSIAILPVIGNHDTLYPIGSSTLPFQSGEEPHGLIKARYPHLFKGKEWYVWDYESLRIVVMCNLVDTADNDYHNCNPPGVKGGGVANADYSGFDTTGSEQQQFIEAAFADSTHLWKIGALHRPVYAPYSTGLDKSRPTQVSQRNGIIRTVIQSGMSVLAQGDQHIRFIGMKYIQDGSDAEATGIDIVAEQTGVGCYPIVNSGTYATRAIDLAYLPGVVAGTHYKYAAGADDDFVGSLTILDFYGDMARCRMWESADDVAAATLVYDGTMWRNPA